MYLLMGHLDAYLLMLKLDEFQPDHKTKLPLFFDKQHNNLKINIIFYSPKLLHAYLREFRLRI